MRHTPVSELRRAIARVRRQRNPRRRRYPAEIRRSVVGHVLAERSRGVSVRSTAVALGVSYKTVCFWLQGRARGFRAVSVKPAQSRPLDSNLRLVTAQGHRIEGLSREDLVYLLRALP